ncbi:hypothetical protein D3C71_1182700 [compost metagenome]
MLKRGVTGRAVHLQPLLLPQRQCHAGFTRHTGHPHIVTGLGAITAQCLASGHVAHGGDRNRQRAARGIAANQGHAVRVGQLEEAVRECIHPRRRCLRQRQGQGAPCRRGAHRGQVGEIHRQRFPADVDGRGFRRKMHAAVERVGGDHQLLAGRHLQQRSVVADAQRHVRPRACTAADALDQTKLIKAHARLPETTTPAPMMPAPA